MEKIVSIPTILSCFSHDFEFKQIPSPYFAQVDIVVKRPVPPDCLSFTVVARYTDDDDDDESFYRMAYSSFESALSAASVHETFTDFFGIDDDDGVDIKHCIPVLDTSPAVATVTQPTGTKNELRPERPPRNGSAMPSSNDRPFWVPPGYNPQDVSVQASPASSGPPIPTSPRPFFLPNGDKLSLLHIHDASASLVSFSDKGNVCFLRRSKADPLVLILCVPGVPDDIKLKSTIALDDCSFPTNLRDVVKFLLDGCATMLVRHPDRFRVSSVSDLVFLKTPIQFFRPASESLITEGLPKAVQEKLHKNSDDLINYFSRPLSALTGEDFVYDEDPRFLGLSGRQLMRQYSELVSFFRDNLYRSLQPSNTVLSACLGTFTRYEDLPPVFQAQLESLKKSPSAQLSLFKSRLPRLCPGYHLTTMAILPNPWPELFAMTYQKTVIHATSLSSFISLLLNGPSSGHRNRFDEGFYTSELLTDAIVYDYGVPSDIGLGFVVIYFALYSPDQARYVTKPMIGSTAKSGYTIAGSDDVLVPFSVSHANRSLESGLVDNAYFNKLMKFLNSGAPLKERTFDLWFPIQYTQDLPSKFYCSASSKAIISMWKTSKGMISPFVKTLRKFSDQHVIEGVLTALSKLVLDEVELSQVQSVFPEFNLAESEA